MSQVRFGQLVGEAFILEVLDVEPAVRGRIALGRG
ncbi:hypothetical protein X737_22410 [Mesorhizobium sp. L48C026A00]|nr:hypothetical protein X737_22410 [Mesorhizobium sp. L48C026A00]